MTARFPRRRFPAAIGRSRRIGDFTLTETLYGPHAFLASHEHESACLIAVLEGTFEERFDGHRRNGAPGMVIFRPAAEPHSDAFDRRGGRCLNLELPAEWMAVMRDASMAFDRSSAFTGTPARHFGHALHEALRLELEDSVSTESMILAMFEDAGGPSSSSVSSPPRWLTRTRERIHDEIGRHVTLRELSRAAQVHPVHLASQFRRHYGLTVGAYARQIRIEYACRALAASDAALAEVALVAGFADQSHFGRTFKRAVGLTPAQYRASHSQP